MTVRPYGYKRGPYWSLYLSGRVHAARRGARVWRALRRAALCLPIPFSVLVALFAAGVAAGSGRCG